MKKVNENLMKVVKNIIKNLEIYPTREDLRGMIPQEISTERIECVLAQLEAQGSIIFNDKENVFMYTDTNDNSMLQELIKRSREAKERPEIIKKLI